MTTKQRQYHKILLIHISGSPKHFALSSACDVMKHSRMKDRKEGTGGKKTEEWLGWPEHNSDE